MIGDSAPAGKSLGGGGGGGGRCDGKILDVNVLDAVAGSCRIAGEASAVAKADEGPAFWFLQSFFVECGASPDVAVMLL